MVLIFDLDDTLYPEITYVLSGFRAVAEMGEVSFGLDQRRSLDELVGYFEREGRGLVFDRWLSNNGLFSKGRVKQCVDCYRHHQPEIALNSCAISLLEKYSEHPLYVVTDGHKIAQQRKVEALGIGDWVKRVFITHRFGVKNAKPSTYCFEKIRGMERCDWKDMVYVGDNPTKDFLNLTPLGVHTVRVLTGSYRDLHVAEEYDASITVKDLSEADDALLQLGFA